MPTADSSLHSNRDMPRAAAPAWSLKWLGDVLQRRLGRREDAADTAPARKPKRSAMEGRGKAGKSAGGGAALRRDHESLRDLLDRHADSRRAMRHLAYVEQAIARRGSRAFKDIPVPVLHKALAQLASLGHADEGGDFTALHARLTMAIALCGDSGAASSPTARALPDAVDVSEASHSLFDEMERSWTGEMPALAANRAN